MRTHAMWDPSAGANKGLKFHAQCSKRIGDDGPINVGPFFFWKKIKIKIIIVGLINKN